MRDNGVNVSSEDYWMKPTQADTAIRGRHAVALSLFRRKKFSLAADTLIQLRKLDSKDFGTYHSDIYNDLGYFLEQANRPAEAIPILEEVVAFDPTRTPAYLNLADAYQKSGDKAKAKANYQKYAELMEKAGKGAKVPARVRAILKP